jgi:hypothetical protein
MINNKDYTEMIILYEEFLILLGYESCKLVTFVEDYDVDET